MLGRLAWLTLVPALAAASGARGGEGAELSYTLAYGTYTAACTAAADGFPRPRRLGAIGTRSGPFSPDGARVAIVGSSAILVENADGSGLHAVSRPRAADEEDGAAAWSPDGRSIAFSRYTGSPRSGIWVVDLATGSERQISHDYAGALSWTGNGDLIAGDFLGQIGLLTPAGARVATLSYPEFKDFDSGVAWSPDGTRLAVGGGAILDRSGAIVARYASPSTDEAVAAAPAWSPDGSTIAFERFATAYDARTNVRYELQADLYTVPAGGGPETRLTATTDVSEWTPAYRPGSGAAPAGTSQRCVIRGTSRGDVLRGTAKGDFILSGSGNDVVDGRGGPDVIDGGPGNDRLTGGPGRDFIRGGAGNDELLTRDGFADTVYGGPGRDRARVDPKLDIVANVEKLER